MLELVVEQGIHATPMSQLAKKSNVAIGTIYHHFKNKNEIIEEIYKMIYKDFGIVLMANLEGHNYQDQFETMWLNLYNYFVTNPLAFKFSEWVGVPPIISREIVNQTKPHYNNVKEFFFRGIKENHLNDINIRLIMQLSYGNVVSAVRLKVKSELPMNKEELKDAIRASWNAIKKQ